jgi:hypothetical protein
VAKYRIRRWFQFGVVDLLVLTTTVAILAFLWRSSEAQARRAKPWVIGIWAKDMSPNTAESIHLYPDGVYRNLLDGQHREGFGWKLTRGAEIEDAYVLVCGEDRFLVRGEWGSGMLEVLNGKGEVQFRLRQWVRLHGPMQGDLPHGTWLFERADSPLEMRAEYREGELVDLRWQGRRAIAALNGLRKLRGLLTLTDRDSSNETVPKRTTP